MTHDTNGRVYFVLLYLLTNNSISVYSGDDSDVLFLFQRASVVQRFNSALLHDDLLFNDQSE